MSAVSTPVQDGPSPLASEELVLGPRSRRTLPRWLPAVALVIGIVVLAAAALWRFWPRPLEPLSLAELQDTYAGMVRSDGTNDASVMTRSTVAETPLLVTPPRCAALVQATVANRFPDAARDGVGTYWLGSGSSISLFTLRFDDQTAADTELDRIVTALDACADERIVVRRGDVSYVQGWAATVVPTPNDSGVDGQVGYTLNGPDGLMAISLMPYLNTLSWQFRYETGPRPYRPLAADQLMQGLHAQLDAVVAARPR
ncbi:MAG TPA: hypothetical protein VFU98_07170 [Microlunatus sp.]|nr:hypothetical protein [Microlunatus sp.]